LPGQAPAAASKNITASGEARRAAYHNLFVCLIIPRPASVGAILAYWRQAQVKPMRGIASPSFAEAGRCALPGCTQIRRGAANRPQPVSLTERSSHHDHDLGAQNWAVLASLIETCKLHGQPRGLARRRADQARRQLAKPPPRRTHSPGPGKPPETPPSAPPRERHRQSGRDQTPNHQASEKPVPPELRLRRTRDPASRRHGIRYGAHSGPSQSRIFAPVAGPVS
jgi:hypothetical protein